MGLQRPFRKNELTIRGKRFFEKIHKEINMKKKFSIFVLLCMMICCLTLGLVSCNGEVDEDEAGRVNPRIVIETEQLEFALDINEPSYYMPYAGVYYENLDRVDGVEVRASLRDPFDMYMFENSLDRQKLFFPFTGKYELIYKAEGCEDATVTIYVCERLPEATNFTLNGDTLTWNSIYGASGYEITVNGKETTFVEEASFTSEIFAQEGFYVGVTAKGDDKEWVDSYMSKYENRIPLKDGELAAFNNPCYESDIVEAKPSIYNVAPSQIEYLTEAECAGSTDGAIRFLMRSGDYGTGLFRVNLQNTIDKNTDFDGIEIRFKIDTKDYIWEEDETTTRFILGLPEADERRVSRGTYLYEGYNDEWQVVQISKSAVEDFDGLKYLQFGLYNMTRSTGKGYLYLDYIRLYKNELDAPQNVAVDGDKLDWSDVENACEYMISVDKTDGANGALERGYYYATLSEIALSELGVDPASATQQYEIKVCAVSAATSVGSSEWSEKVVKRAEVAEDQLSPMDNAIYALDVVNPVLNDGKRALTHIWWTEYQQVAGAEGGYAVRLATNAQSTYGKYSAFTVKLREPLNLEGAYNCVVLRFKLEFSNYQSKDTLGIQLVGSDYDTQNYTGLSYRQIVKEGEWTEFQISVNDLKAYYETGDDKISFAFVNTEENKGGNTVYLKVALDNLRYDNDPTLAPPAEPETPVEPETPAELLLASFTDANNGTISNVDGYGWGSGKTATYRTAPFYEGETAKAGIYMDRYHVDGSSTKLAAFKVTLPKGLDLTKDGIVIRVNIYDKSGSLTLDKFTLLSKDGQATWQNKTSADFPGATATYQQWMEVKLSSADLQAMGYATGDTTLYFGCWTTNEVAKHLSTGIWFQLDAITYYKNSEA